LQAVAADGYTVTAVDLPGFGQSAGQVPLALRAYFLAGLVQALDLAKEIVVVAPSMSGTFAVPLLTSQLLPGLRGLVAVAAAGLSEHTPAELDARQVPILYIYGELDSGLGQAGVRALRDASMAELREMPNASHPCYLDDPATFNQWLLEFLAKL
jgi:abhydrolase domain-containing protein 14